MKTTAAFFLITLSCVLPVTTGRSEVNSASKGLRILEAKCSRCHAVGKEGASPHAQAPPFRDVVIRYPPVYLAEALAEGIVAGHPDMPVFTFEPGEIDAIVGYLNSITPAR
jgi:cytochrome c